LLDKATTELLRDLVLYDFKFYFEQVAFPGFCLTETHKQAFDFFDGAESNFLLGFPGSSKSTALHTARHAWMANRNRWEILNGLAERPMVFGSGSYNLKTAVNLFTRSIKRQLALPLMAFLFGPLIDPNCSDAGFNLLGLDYSHEKDNAIQAYGIAEGDVAGAHADILTLDDIVTFRLARSPVERDALREKMAVDIRRVLRRPPHRFAETLRPPQINILGYPHHSQDIYADLQDESQYPSFAGRLKTWPALNDAGQSSFPELYPTEEVLRWRKDTPEIIWRGVYLIKHKGMAGDIIKDTWLRWWAEEAPPEYLQVFVGGDLSIGATEEAARTAYFALGYEPKTEKRWELDCIYGHWTLGERIKNLKEFCEPYKNSRIRPLMKVALEKPASGSDIVQILSTETSLPVEAVTAVKDKNTRLVEKQPLFEFGKMILRGPERNDYIPRIGTWVEELLGRRTTVIPANGTVDRTDAFILADNAIGQRDGYMEFLERLKAGMVDAGKT